MDKLEARRKSKREWAARNRLNKKNGIASPRPNIVQARNNYQPTLLELLSTWGDYYVAHPTAVFYHLMFQIPDRANLSTVHSKLQSYSNHLTAPVLCKTQSGQLHVHYIFTKLSGPTNHLSRHFQSALTLKMTSKHARRTIILKSWAHISTALVYVSTCGKVSCCPGHATIGHISSVEYDTSTILPRYSRKSKIQMIQASYTPSITAKELSNIAACPRCSQHQLCSISTNHMQSLFLMGFVKCYVRVRLLIPQQQRWAMFTGCVGNANRDTATYLWPTKKKEPIALNALIAGSAQLLLNPTRLSIKADSRVKLAYQKVTSRISQIQFQQNGRRSRSD